MPREQGGLGGFLISKLDGEINTWYGENVCCRNILDVGNVSIRLGTGLACGSQDGPDLSADEITFFLRVFPWIVCLELEYRPSWLIL